TSCQASPIFCRTAGASAYISAARLIRSAIVADPVDVDAVPASIRSPPQAGNGERDSTAVLRLRGAGVRGPWTCRLPQARHEEGLIDAALENRDAQLHALGDDFPALETCLTCELSGRQVNGHMRHPSCGISVHRKGSGPGGRAQRLRPDSADL